MNWYRYYRCWKGNIVSLDKISPFLYSKIDISAASEAVLLFLLSQVISHLSRVHRKQKIKMVTCNNNKWRMCPTSPPADVDTHVIATQYDECYHTAFEQRAKKVNVSVFKYGKTICHSPTHQLKTYMTYHVYKYGISTAFENE